MSDEPWLRELAQVKRDEDAEERSRLDERWDRLSAGELSPEEEAGLRALAGTSEEAREAYEAFRPLGPDFHARVVNAVRAERKPAEPRSRILPFRPAARLGGWLTAAAAVAAVLVLFLRTPASPPLPDYTITEMDGGIRTQRGDPAAAGLPVFVPGSRLTLVVKPPQPITDEVEARSFLSNGSRIDPWEPSVQIARGVVKLEGSLGDQLPAGSWRVWVVVGRPGGVPSDKELMASLRAGRSRDDSWQAVHAELRVEARPPP
jgi:hypothetical protein